MSARRAQRGAALVAAIFLLVVLAALGAYAMRINLMQRHDAQLELLEERAESALSSGIEYAATRLLASGADNCANLAPLANVVDSFTVSFNNCQYLPVEQVAGIAVHTHTVTVVASSGVYGTPEFVLRQATDVRITDY